jgi:uncharacterized YigZ family protein
MEDTYFTIARPTEAELKVLGSRFLAYAVPVVSRAAALEELDQLRKRFFDATHHCYAFRMGTGGDDFRANDDGEPAGTAGKPILNAIDSQKLTDIILVVVRYFGGTKLGTGGLAHAYGGVAAAALQKAEVLTKFLTETLMLTFPHHQTGNVMNAVSQHSVRVTDSLYDEDVHLTIEVRRSSVDAFLAQVVNATRGNIDIRRSGETTTKGGS